jgi:hypothetical protein
MCEQKCRETGCITYLLDFAETCEAKELIYRIVFSHGMIEPHVLRVPSPGKQVSGVHRRAESSTTRRSKPLSSHSSAFHTTGGHHHSTSINLRVTSIIDASLPYAEPSSTTFP